MAELREAYICDAVRTPIGRFGGVLAQTRTDGRPLARNLKGRTLFARGFVAGLVRIARYALRPAPARDAKIVPAQTIKRGYNLL